jgi:hypothetical protein
LAFFRFFSLRFATIFAWKWAFRYFAKTCKTNNFFRYFASPKFATFSHLFASSENLGDTLCVRGFKSLHFKIHVAGIEIMWRRD